MWAVRVSLNGGLGFASSGGEFELELGHRPSMKMSELWLPFKPKFSVPGLEPSSMFFIYLGFYFI